MILKLRLENKQALASGFREYYGCSIYDLGHTLSYSEAYDLIVGLFRKPESMLNEAYNGKHWTLEVQLLAQVHNIILNTSSVKQADKKARMIKLPQPKKPRKKKEMLTLEQMKHQFKPMKIAEAPTMTNERKQANGK